MTRQCLGGRDRIRIYGTEYARVKPINGKTCCRPSLPRTFRPFRFRTKKPEGPSIEDEGKILVSPARRRRRALRCLACRSLPEREQFSTKRRLWRRGLGPCGGVSPTIQHASRWVRPQASPHWVGLAARQECGMTVSQGNNRSPGKIALRRLHCIHSTEMLPLRRHRLRPCG